MRILENKTTAIAKSVSRVEQDLDRARHDLAAADANLGQTFPHTAALQVADLRPKAVREALAAKEREKNVQEQPVTPAV